VSGSRRRYSRRSVLAVAILVMWTVGLGTLARREMFRPPLERLARAALLVAPGASYYAVFDGDRHVGFASSTIDTTERMILVTDYLVAVLGAPGRPGRTTATTAVRLSRGLRMIGFEALMRGGANPIEMKGDVEGDSLLRIIVTEGGSADTHTVALRGPVLLPTLLPLAAVLAGDPAVGRTVQFPVFDPSSRTAVDVRLAVDAESLFVVHDSASFDSLAGRWVALLPDTLRAWHLRPVEGPGFTGWVDEQGYVLRTTALGSLTLERAPFEIAWENWRLGLTDTAVAAAGNVFDTTPIAAGRAAGVPIRELHVRLTGAQLAGFPLAAPRQLRRGDSLLATHPTSEDLRARYSLPMRSFNAFREFLEPEPLIESDHPSIVQLARRISGAVTDPRQAVERIHEWVADSLRKSPVKGAPGAVEVLRTRTGDGAEHARLAVALARAAGVPARIVEGLVRVDGSFHYHSWAEVRLRDWVGFDPALGQFPADAGHLRFTVGGRPSTAALLRLIGTVRIDVLSETR
jgi:hypothetical protein